MSTLTTFVISMVEPILFYSSSFSVSHVRALKKLPTIHPLTNRSFCKHHANDKIDRQKSTVWQGKIGRRLLADFWRPIISADFYLSCVMGFRKVLSASTTEVFWHSGALQIWLLLLLLLLLLKLLPPDVTFSSQNATNSILAQDQIQQFLYHVQIVLSEPQSEHNKGIAGKKLSESESKSKSGKKGLQSGVEYCTTTLRCAVGGMKFD